MLKNDLQLKVYSNRMITDRLGRGMLLAVFVCASLSESDGQARGQVKQAYVTCSFESHPSTPYGFAMVTLEALWDAHRATKDSTAGISESEPDHLLTTMMRDIKLSTNDFICARQEVERFALKKTPLLLATTEQRSNIRLAAQAEVRAYNLHIALNDRMLALLRSKYDSAAFSDKISTIQVERGELWVDLLPPVTLALMSMVDMRGTDENGTFLQTSDPSIGQTGRLTMTLEQKKGIVDYLAEHFPELNDGTSQEQLSDPARMAKIYLALFNQRKCSDE